MKSKDMILIGLIVLIGGVISFIVCGMIFNSPAKKQQQAETVRVITAELNKPDTRFFNSSAFDPTKTIVIGQGNNPSPFSGTQQ